MTVRIRSGKPERGLGHWLKHLGVAESEGVELFGLLAGVARLFEVIADHNLQAADLSVPRLRLLVWLYVEEQRGNRDGLSPSCLSRFQHVSKNTISSLLASLEAQGLIERTLSREDKRKFNIRLSRVGRELVCATLPAHSGFLNELLKGLTRQEQKTLIALLRKLRQMLVARAPHDELAFRKSEEGA